MRIGHNRNRIKIVSFNTVKDAGGGWSVEAGEQFVEEYTEDFGSPSENIYWETNAEVLEPIKDKYKAEVFQVGIEETVEFLLRHRPDKNVTKFMQVVFKNKYHTIHGIQDVGYRGRELKLSCKVKE